MKRLFLVAAAALCMALPLAAQARQGPSDVWITTAFGDTLQVMRQHPPHAVSISDAQSVSASWMHKQKVITVRTDRERDGTGQWEPISEWVARHRAAVTGFEKSFPPDAPPPGPQGPGGDTVGSLPGPRHGGPSKQSITIEWVSELKLLTHKAEQQESEPVLEYVQRVTGGDTALVAAFPQG